MNSAYKEDGMPQRLSMHVQKSFADLHAHQLPETTVGVEREGTILRVGAPLEIVKLFGGDDGMRNGGFGWNTGTLIRVNCGWLDSKVNSNFSPSLSSNPCGKVAVTSKSRPAFGSRMRTCGRKCVTLATATGCGRVCRTSHNLSAFVPSFRIVKAELMARASGPGGSTICWGDTVIAG